GHPARAAARPGQAGVLPARRGHGALPARPGRAGRGGGAPGRGGGHQAAVRGHPGAAPDGGGRGQLLRGREVGPVCRAARASQIPASATITPTPTPSTPYDRPPTITPATTVPDAPQTFMSRSDRPCTAGRPSISTDSLTSAEPATSPHDQPRPSTNSATVTCHTRWSAVAASTAEAS